MPAKHSKVLFANIGWMISYNGQHPGDIIVKGTGGSYPDKNKHEAYNFQNLHGKCYGYVQPRGHAKRINIGKIDSSASAKTESIEGVTVIWIANRKEKESTSIVGWYRNATVYRCFQKSDSRQRQHFSFNIEADYEECTLLPVDERTINIPRGKHFMGQANVWYANDAEASDFRAKVLDYIDNYTPSYSAPKRRLEGSTHGSAEKRTEVEKAAVKEIKRIYRKRGYKVKSVEESFCGWDLEATKILPESDGLRELYLEVKGQGDHKPYVRITRNGYEKMQAHSDKYRLCVVTNALKDPQAHIFIHTEDDHWVCESNSAIELDIDEQIAAVATFKLNK